MINTNYNYLATMGIAEEDPLVGVIVSVYYLGCAVGAVIASWFSNIYGRRPGIYATLLTASLGNLIMFIAGIRGMPNGLVTMMIGRIIMGLGVGKIYSSIFTFGRSILMVSRRYRCCRAGLHSRTFRRR